MDKTDYILRSLSKIRHKKWELFVISRIIHKLDDDEIEFVTQQLVRLDDGKRALTDLYFPQFGIHLEVNEAQHFQPKHIKDDERRNQSIVALTEHEVHRIDVADGDGKYLDLSAVKVKVDEFVIMLKSLKEALRQDGSFQPWDLNKKFDPKTYIKAGFVDVGQGAYFRYQKDALECFGYKGGHYQQGAWKIPNSNDRIWFPRLYEIEEWDNSLSADGLTITEKPKSDWAKELIKLGFEKGFTSEQGKRIVFARESNALGVVLYRYVGSFELDKRATTENMTIYRQVSDKEAIRY